MPAPLPDGLYEHIITDGLHQGLGELDTQRRVERGEIDTADTAHRFARHLAAEIERSLETVPEKARPQAQVAIANRLLEALRSAVPEAGTTDARIREEGSELRAIYRAAAPARPTTPMSSSTLLTRSRSEPSLGLELAREVASANHVDVLVAFITMSGVRALRSELEAFARRGTGLRLRVLTTVFSGITEPEAVEFLARLPGAEVRVSYDTRRTRLHAKAWLFQRDSQLHSAYIGSANLTSTALGSGQEWMVKVCAADLPHVVEKFRGTFESLWNDAEFERFDPDSESSQDRLRLGLRGDRADATEFAAFFQLKPFPFQQEILDRLDAERIAHGRMRNLVVAATGTGKTVVAAFDYKRQMERSGVTPRLLFLAHRGELLKQARDVFRHVLRDHAFGELLDGDHEPERWEHVFSTIQSAGSRSLLARLGPQHFRYVVVDECHHAPSDSYQALIPHLEPDILLGLTATPERSDGKSLLGDFGGRIAAELRIWDALDRQLLVPFEYYGISDGVNLEHVRWSRAGYDHDELERVYTGNEKRVDLIVEQLGQRVANLKQVRALAFCVSVAHAEFMARALTARGLPALAIHGGSSSNERSDAPRRLQRRECNVLCTCDLYNEGVDLPFVDTLLFLRPTQSVTLFLQQLGRGLRHGEEGETKKTSCLVLDFIGRQRAEFRFDGIYSALSGVPRSRLTKALEEGFPYLPSGCVFKLDAVSREHVLASLREHLRKRSRLVDEVRELHAETGQVPSLRDFLDETPRDLEDVYDDRAGWTGLLRQAGVISGEDAEADDLSRRLGWLLHTDERARFDTWRAAAEGVAPSSELERRRFTMLAFQLQNRGIVKTAEETAEYFRRKTPVSIELRDLADVLDDRLATANPIQPVVDWPLVLHAHYGRREIVAAIGYTIAGAKGRTPQGGILKIADKRQELLFVTLDKSHHSFSPTTRYRDYAISPELFHWETQSVASVDQESGKRYTESPGNGWTFHLFVRSDRDAPYAYLGPVRRVSHEGDRPIAITWRLEYPMSAALFARYATLAQG